MDFYYIEWLMKEAANTRLKLGAVTRVFLCSKRTSDLGIKLSYKINELKLCLRVQEDELAQIANEVWQHDDVWAQLPMLQINN